MAPDAESPEVGCRLAAADQELRLAWVKELNTAALREYRREGTRIELTYDPLAGARVREFVRREQECCPFLDFTVRQSMDAVTVVIAAPENAGEAADALFASYISRSRRGETKIVQR